MSTDLFSPADRDVIAAHIGELELTPERLQSFFNSALDQASEKYETALAAYRHELMIEREEGMPQPAPPPVPTPQDAVSDLMANLRAALDAHSGNDGRARALEEEMAKAIAEAELVNAAVDILDARYRKAIPEPHNFPTDMNDKLINWDPNAPPAEVLVEAFPDEDYAALKQRLLVELGSLRNMLVGNIPMSAEEQAQKLARLAVLEHPKFQTWFQG